MVCCRTNAHSRSSSGPGLERISSGHGELAEVVELRRAVELFELVAAEPEHPPDLAGERADARRSAPGARARVRTAPRAAPPSCGRSRPAASTSARTGARRRAAGPGSASVGLVGEHDRAERRLDLEPFAPLGESGAGAVDERLGLAVLDSGEEAELVAAEPVGRAVRAGHGRELLAEPREQRVAGRVAERVVVALEAVEVEEHEKRRPDGLGRRRRAVEVGDAAGGGSRARSAHPSSPPGA